jgi:hypothetical protein
MTDDLSKPTAPNQFGNPRIIDSRSMQSAQVATLKSGQQNVSSEVIKMLVEDLGVLLRQLFWDSMTVEMKSVCGTRQSQKPMAKS